MKTPELRDATVARVKDAYEEYPNFESLPALSESQTDVFDMHLRFRGDLSVISNYVSALYSVCANATPVGRIGNDGIAGVYDEDAVAAGQRNQGGLRLGATGE